MKDKKRDDRYVRIKYMNAMRTMKNARARSHISSKTEVFVSNNIMLAGMSLQFDILCGVDVCIVLQPKRFVAVGR